MYMYMYIYYIYIYTVFANRVCRTDFAHLCYMQRLCTDALSDFHH